MGDRTWTGIMFSGVIAKNVAEMLLNKLDEQGCVNESGSRDLTLDDLRKPHEQFSDEECNYAVMEGVESFCEKNGISYRKVWDAGAGFENGYMVYNAVTDLAFEVTGGPSIGIDQLRAFAKEGKTIDEVVAYLDTFSKFEQHYPALEIED